MRSRKAKLLLLPQYCLAKKSLHSTYSLFFYESAPNSLLYKRLRLEIRFGTDATRGDTVGPYKLNTKQVRVSFNVFITFMDMNPLGKFNKRMNWKFRSYLGLCLEQ